MLRYRSFLRCKGCKRILLQGMYRRLSMGPFCEIEICCFENWGFVYELLDLKSMTN
jgi:hypothetical protein